MASIAFGSADPERIDAGWLLDGLQDVSSPEIMQHKRKPV
jgi:hypothetical protein